MPLAVKHTIGVFFVFALVSCAHYRPLRPASLALRLELVPSNVRDRILIRHHLVNRSSSTVCVGGTQRFFVEGHVVQVTILHDAVCRSPEIVAEPGRVAEWTEEFAHGNCLRRDSSVVSMIPPHLRCGEVQLKSQITLFELLRGGPVRGSAVTVNASMILVRGEPSADQQTYVTPSVKL